VLGNPVAGNVQVHLAYVHGVDVKLGVCFGFVDLAVQWH
jgi:hypothetical protein